MGVDKRLVFALAAVLALSVFVYAVVQPPASGSSVEKWFAFLNARLVDQFGSGSSQGGASKGLPGVSPGTFSDIPTQYGDGIEVEYDAATKSYSVTCTRWETESNRPSGFWIDVAESVPGAASVGKTVVHGRYYFECGWLRSQISPALVVYRQGTEKGAQKNILDCSPFSLVRAGVAGGVGAGAGAAIGAWTPIGPVTAAGGAILGGTVGVATDVYYQMAKGISLGNSVRGWNGTGEYACDLGVPVSSDFSYGYSKIAGVKVLSGSLKFASAINPWSIELGTFKVQIIPDGANSSYPKVAFDKANVFK